MNHKSEFKSELLKEFFVGAFMLSVLVLLVVVVLRGVFLFYSAYVSSTQKSPQLEIKLEDEKPVIAQAVKFPPKDGWHIVYPYEIHDGDTVKVYFLVEGTIRLSGLNAPELNTDEGKKAKKWLEKRLPPRVTTIRLGGTEKFGRTLGEFFDTDGFSINKMMIDSKIAKPWDGQGDKP